MSRNLVDLKKEAGLTNAQIGRALGCSAGTAGNILHGTHIGVYSDIQIQRLANVLGVTFERCWYAMCESYNERMNTPGMQHQRASEVRARVEEALDKKMPDIGIEISTPRPLKTIEAISLIGE